MTTTAKIATTATIAAELATTPRTLRKFLRSQGAGVGKGSRYALPANARALTAMRRDFTAWSAEVDAARAAKVESTESDITDEVDNDDELLEGDDEV